MKADSGLYSSSTATFYFWPYLAWDGYAAGRPQTLDATPSRSGRFLSPGTNPIVS